MASIQVFSGQNACHVAILHGNGLEIKNMFKDYTLAVDQPYTIRNLHEFSTLST